MQRKETERKEINDKQGGGEKNEENIEKGKERGKREGEEGG